MNEQQDERPAGGTFCMASDRLWGAEAIARFAGVSVATVYRWQELDECPITKRGGRYFSTRSALSGWLMPEDAR
jgi:hypothetical protein